ncbi:hypothetical protein MIMGU_mgv1a023729mg [Erythranthe guttata]|uniref:NB-ARC domain-containing protein n=1 Tax=Erythranthe guttata TaxID=4155 RepID=A0A022Q723_ERYGU|nr:hypothetical protein MIMGU_mgv1a023729mg [Erythranthe guttata]
MAYAALVSLMNTIDDIRNHHRFSTSVLDNKQVESLDAKLYFLLDFIESGHSHELLESQIASAAHAAEDVIESHVVDQIDSDSVSSLDLHAVIEHLDSVKEKVFNVVKEERVLFNDHLQQGPTFSSFAPRSSSSINGNSKMVGFDEELFQLLDALTGRQSSLQIIPIVGMGGIGKTTLARNAYEHRLISNHFDVCAWVTISQEYSVKEIFSKLLSRQSSQSADEQQLAQELYQSLIGRRYLIILDDIWSIDAWEKMMFFFPDNNNGSRIILTTRLSNVAVYFGSSYFSMKFLDEYKSWKLFCENAFPQEGCCPPELEEIGKKIVKKCKGLPLLIVVIGALLRKSSKTREYWENISENMNSILDSSKNMEQSVDILSLSYSNLPAHLKPCFLYMGIFPEDSVIYVSQLIKLWVAEGFIKSTKTQTLEEIAEDHLKDLVDRNLILPRKLRSTGKTKTCTIHDLLRDLCIKAAEKEKFLIVMRVNDVHINAEGIYKERRIVCHQEIPRRQFIDAFESASLIRSFATNSNLMEIELKLLRVLFAPIRRYNNDLYEILKQVNLRYVCVRPEVWEDNFERFQKISRVWNLQTLTIRDDADEVFVTPSEIWEMVHLRHVEFNKVFIVDPPSKSNDFVLRNLQTVEGVIDLRLSDEVCKRIPNLKKLKITFNDVLSERSSRHYSLYNIGRLHKLESLKCCFRNILDGSNSPLNLMALPTSLKKLTLQGCCLHSEDLAMIGSLPHLQFLKLAYVSIVGSEWDPVEGGFLQLKFLKIYSCRDLKYWNADSSHFPVLENIKFVEVDRLVEVPLGVGEIPTLGAIELVRCTESVAMSAVRILEEQESFGNEAIPCRTFEVYILKKFYSDLRQK